MREERLDWLAAQLESFQEKQKIADRDPTVCNARSAAIVHVRFNAACGEDVKVVQQVIDLHAAVLSSSACAIVDVCWAVETVVEGDVRGIDHTNKIEVRSRLIVLRTQRFTKP
jgi:hypothetical protein